MAVRWRIPFRSRLGNYYTVNIYDPSWTSSPVVLNGGAEPFVTQENNDDDAMSPVRLSTGYIRVITGKRRDGVSYDASSIWPPTPKARPVTLTDGSANVLWQGYIKQEEFSQPWAPDPYEQEFPIVSALGILEGVQIVDGEMDSRARIAGFFDKAIMAAADGSGTIGYDTIVFPADMAESYGGNTDAFWYFGILTRNFFDYVNENLLDDTESRYDGMSWLDILTEIVRSFGYTLYEQGRRLFIVSNVWTNYSYIYRSFLPYMAQGISETVYGFTRYTKQIANYNLADANGNAGRLLPAKRAIVKSEINSFDEDCCPMIDTKYLDFVTILNVVFSYASDDPDYTGPTGEYFKQDLATYEQTPGSAIWTFHSFLDGEEVAWSSQDIQLDHNIGAFVRNMAGENAIYIHYDNVDDGTAYGGDYLVQVKSPTTTFFAGGRFLLSGKLTVEGGVGDTAEHKGEFCLRVGSYYYDADNDTWTTTKKKFIVSIDKDNGSIGFINSANNAGDAKGYAITVPDAGIYGEVELFIGNVLRATDNSQSGQRVSLYTNLRLEYTEPPADLFKDYPTSNNNRFVQSLNTYAAEDKEISIMLSSFIHNRMGYGVMLDSGLSLPLQQIYCKGTYQYFEQMVIDAIASCFTDAKRTLEVPLLTDEQLSPVDRWYYWTNYAYKGVARNWRDDSQTIKLIEL